MSVEGKGEYPAPDSGLWDVLLNFQVQYRYADGVVLDYHTDKGAFLRVEGEDGWIHAPWLGGQMTASDPAILRIKLKDSDLRLPLRQDKEDFLNGIKNTATTMADAEVGQPHLLDVPDRSHRHPTGPQAPVEPRHGTLHGR